MESFYGPWNVRLNHVDPYFRQRFIISGSDQADGRYEVSSGGVVNLEVTGSAWFVSLETERPRRQSHLAEPTQSTSQRNLEPLQSGGGSLSATPADHP